MAQIRYRDWKSPITSKGSVEPQALSLGIGPQFGFDDITYEIVGSNNYKITIGAKNVANPGSGNLSKDNFITNRFNQVNRYHGAVTTPDGILTLIDSPLEFTVLNSNQFTAIPGVLPPLLAGQNYKEFILKASHVYIEDDSVQSPTIFNLAVNDHGSLYEGGVTYLDPNDELTGPPKTMADWYDTNPDAEPDHTNQVIVALIIINLSDPSKSFSICPYFYQWPQPKVLPESLWYRQIKKIYDSLEEYASDQLSLSGHDKSSIVISSSNFGPAAPNNSCWNFVNAPGRVSTIVKARTATVSCSGINIIRSAFSINNKPIELEFNLTDIFPLADMLEFGGRIYDDIRNSYFPFAIYSLAQFLEDLNSSGFTPTGMWTSVGMVEFLQLGDFGSNFVNKSMSLVYPTIVKGTSGGSDSKIKFVISPVDATLFDYSTNVTLRFSLDLKF